MSGHNTIAGVSYVRTSLLSERLFRISGIARKTCTDFLTPPHIAAQAVSVVSRFKRSVPRGSRL